MNCLSMPAGIFLRRSPPGDLEGPIHLGSTCWVEIYSTRTSDTLTYVEKDFSASYISKDRHCGIVHHFGDLRHHLHELLLSLERVLQFQLGKLGIFSHGRKPPFEILDVGLEDIPVHPLSGPFESRRGT